MLKRVQVTYEFAIDAPNGTDREVLEILAAQAAMAISDDRCGIVSGPIIETARSSTQFQESTLDEVPLGAFDHTLRERFELGE